MSVDVNRSREHLISLVIYKKVNRYEAYDSLVVHDTWRACID